MSRPLTCRIPLIFFSFSPSSERAKRWAWPLTLALRVGCARSAAESSDGEILPLLLALFLPYRVQFGFALTAAEKLKITATSRATFVRGLQDGFLNKDDTVHRTSRHVEPESERRRAKHFTSSPGSAL
ncbi:hypothetical protein K438DRAFT_1990380 [Mycena galopus ATCC 62051]|nr:hypothetical protein K438DRAFT_1990380 [Mycena galopus ATCC 62051]